MPTKHTKKSGDEIPVKVQGQFRAYEAKHDTEISKTRRGKIWEMAKLQVKDSNELISRLLKKHPNIGKCTDDNLESYITAIGQEIMVENDHEPRGRGRMHDLGDGRGF